jgi:tetratricopeptide (TPR) repeat protein
MKKLFFFVPLLLFSVSSITAQRDEFLPRPSPNASVSQSIGYTTITINYCRPGVKGRKILGEIVPYNKIWRTGANESTTIQFTTDVTVEGNKVPAGIYSLFTIPTENEWTVILNKAYKNWGLSYDEKEDHLRFKVQPSKGNFTERLQYSFAEITDNSAYVLINWENFQISFKMEIDLGNQFYKAVNEKIAIKPDDWSIYADAAQYAANNELLLTEALRWIDQAISINKVYTAYYIKAKVLLKMNKTTEALKSLETCRNLGRTDKNWDTFVSQVDFLEKQIKSKMD